MDECIALQEIENGTGGGFMTAPAQLPWEFHVWESVVIGVVVSAH